VTRGANRNLVVLWSANFLTAAGLMAMLPFFPLFLRDMGLSDERAVAVWAGVIVGAAPLTAALMAGFWGALGDQVGRRAMVLRALLGVTVFSGAMAFATSPVHLLLLRIGQGMFSGFLAPAVTLVSVTTPPERQGRIGGLLHSAVLLGATCGPVFGALVGVRGGLAGTAVACAALAFVACALVRLLVAEPPRAAAAPAPQAEDGARPRGVVARSLADVALALRDPTLRALMLSLILVRLALSAVEPTLVVYVEQIQQREADATTGVAGLVFACYPLAIALSVPFWSRRADRKGARRVLAGCIVAMAACMALAATASSAPLLAASRFACGVFAGGVLPCAFAAAGASSPAHRRGSALGLTFSALTLGLAFGPPLGGLVAGTFGFAPLFLASGGVLALATVPLSWKGRGTDARGGDRVAASAGAG
jgi:DHA1 family multidrug resistance protein-like MFS transporter